MILSEPNLDFRVSNLHIERPILTTAYNIPYSILGRVMVRVRT